MNQFKKRKQIFLLLILRWIMVKNCVFVTIMIDSFYKYTSVHEKLWMKINQGGNSICIHFACWIETIWFTPWTMDILCINISMVYFLYSIKFFLLSRKVLNYLVVFSYNMYKRFLTYISHFLYVYFLISIESLIAFALLNCLQIIIYFIRYLILLYSNLIQANAIMVKNVVIYLLVMPQVSHKYEFIVHW